MLGRSSSWIGCGKPMWDRSFAGRRWGSSGQYWNPRTMGNTAAWYDINDLSSLVYDGSNRVQLVADKSGNSSTNVLCLNGVAGNYASAPDANPLDITGDIDLRAHIAPTSWATTQALFDKYVTSKSYALVLMSTGVLRLVWSTNGTADTVVESTAATGFAAFTKKWVRATLDVDNGAGGYTATFYTSDDGTTWTQLGNTVVGGATTSIFAGTSILQVGAAATGTASLFNGLFYRAQIYNGIAGTLAFDANFATFSKLATSGTESSSNAATVTINTSGATGARISGARDLVQMTAASQPIYLPFSGTNYGYLNGVSGNYFSTPDSAAVSITGDIDLRSKIQYVGGIAGVIMARDNILSQRSYNFNVTAGNFVKFYWTTDGTSGTGQDTSSTAAITNFDQWLRVTLDVDNGAGGYDVKFWTSPDGVTWTQLGTTVTGVGTTSIFNGTAELRIGATGDGLNRLPMNCYRAQIYNGINGTLAFDLNPSAYVSGTTFLDSSSNAATITLNGGATIVTRTSLYFDGSNDYLKAAAFGLAQPETVYFCGSQVTWTSGGTVYAGGAVDALNLFQTGSTPSLSLYAGTASAANASATLSTNFIGTAVFNGASSVNRVNRGTGTTGNPGAISGNGFTVGANTAGASPSNITFSEAIIRSVADDTAAQNRLALYLGLHNHIAV